jgi:hypothetical protein
MQTILVKDIVPIPFSYRDGVALYEAIKPYLNSYSDRVALDFTDIRGLNSHFLAGFLGSALDYCGEPILKDSVRIIKVGRTNGDAIQNFITKYR